MSRERAKTKEDSLSRNGLGGGTFSRRGSGLSSQHRLLPIQQPLRSETSRPLMIIMAQKIIKAHGHQNATRVKIGAKKQQKLCARCQNGQSKSIADSRYHPSMLQSYYRYFPATKSAILLVHRVRIQAFTEISRNALTFSSLNECTISIWSNF